MLSPLERATYSVRSPPPCGEGLGVGVARLARSRCHSTTPSPALPHKGGGNRPSLPLQLSPSILQELAPCSLRPDAGRANEFCPFGDVGANLSGKRLGRISDRLKTERGQLLLHGRPRDDVDDLAMKERGDLLGRSCRRQQR